MQRTSNEKTTPSCSSATRPDDNGSCEQHYSDGHGRVERFRDDFDPQAVLSDITSKTVNTCTHGGKPKTKQNKNYGSMIELQPLKHFTTPPDEHTQC